MESNKVCRGGGFWLTQPEWVVLYIFEPGTTREEIREIAGIRNIRLPRVVNEGYTQILFIGDGRVVVCNIHSNDKDYEFDFGEFEDTYIKVYFYQPLPVELTRSEETGRIVVRLLTARED